MHFTFSKQSVANVAVILATSFASCVIVKGQDSPFNSTSVDFLGNMVARAGYDLKPKVMYDSTAPPDRRYMMAWFGQFQDGEQDISTPNEEQLFAGDRIYVSFAPFLNGSQTPWTAPQVVWKGQAGTTGQDETDDHLVGSPSILKVGDTYYMFIESYGYFATKINRFFNFDLGDTWATHGWADGNGILNDWIPGYNFEGQVDLGYASLFRKAGMRPVYSGEVTYSPDNKINRFLTTNPNDIIPRTDGQGQWRPLFNSKPVFWVYENDAVGHSRKPLYTFFDGIHRNTYATNDPNGGGVPGASFVSLLGYVPTSLTTPDTIGCFQNRIRLLKSNDGLNWQAVDGGARGGAVIAPMDETTSRWPHGCPNPAYAFDPHRAYGSGFPISLVRDDKLELYFTDDTELHDQQPECGINPQLWRVVIQVSQIENAQSYLDAERVRTNIVGFPMEPWTGYYVSDIKWSELHKRYFGYGIDPVSLAPEILWTETEPTQDAPPSFLLSESIPFEVPSDRLFGWGGILGNELGQTIDFNEGPNPYSALHVVHEDFPASDVNPFTSEISHTLIFGYFDQVVLPGDVNGDGAVDLQDVQPFVVVVTNNEFSEAADMNSDGVVNLLDVQPFVNALVGN